MLNYVYVYMFVCGCLHECRCSQKPEEDIGALELELLVIVSWQTWVLRNKFWSSAKPYILSPELCFQFPYMHFFKDASH